MVTWDPTYGMLTVDGRQASLTRQQAQIFDLLWKRRPAFVHSDALIDFLWGDRADGGPLHADGSLKVQITHARNRLKKAGITRVTIRSKHSFGYGIVIEEGTPDAARLPLPHPGVNAGAQAPR